MAAQDDETNEFYASLNTFNKEAAAVEVMTVEEEIGRDFKTAVEWVKEARGVVALKEELLYDCNFQEVDEVYERGMELYWNMGGEELFESDEEDEDGDGNGNGNGIGIGNADKNIEPQPDENTKLKFTRPWVKIVKIWLDEFRVFLRYRIAYSTWFAKSESYFASPTKLDIESLREISELGSTFPSDLLLRKRIKVELDKVEAWLRVANSVLGGTKKAGESATRSMISEGDKVRRLVLWCSSVHIVQSYIYIHYFSRSYPAPPPS